MLTTPPANQIIDLIHIHIRKHLSECRGRSRSELEVLFGDLRNEVTQILEDANAVEDDDESNH
jgi:hypothetical protein